MEREPWSLLKRRPKRWAQAAGPLSWWYHCPSYSHQICVASPRASPKTRERRQGQLIWSPGSSLGLLLFLPCFLVLFSIFQPLFSSPTPFLASFLFSLTETCSEFQVLWIHVDLCPYSEREHCVVCGVQVDDV